MKTADYLALLIVCLGLSITSTRAEASGLGVILGEPTGICGKVQLARNHGVQGAAAWSLSGDHEFHLQGDYLYQYVAFLEENMGRLPFYLGIGGRLKFRSNRDNKVGVRFPLGLHTRIGRSRFDLFGELAPILDLAPDTDFDFAAAIGVRYYF